MYEYPRAFKFMVIGEVLDLDTRYCTYLYYKVRPPVGIVELLLCRLLNYYYVAYHYDIFCLI